MSKGWSWNMLPKRLLEDERFLALTLVERGLLLSLYMVADKYGVLPASPRALARLSGLHPDEIRVACKLHDAGLAEVFQSHDGWWFIHLEDYLDDRPSEMRKAPETGWPQPHPDRIRISSGQVPEWLRTEDRGHPESIQVSSGWRPDDARKPSDDAESGCHPDVFRTPSGLDETRQDKTRQEAPSEAASLAHARGRAREAETSAGRSSRSPAPELQADTCSPEPWPDNDRPPDGPDGPVPQEPATSTRAGALATDAPLTAVPGLPGGGTRPGAGQSAPGLSSPPSWRDRGKRSGGMVAFGDLADQVVASGRWHPDHVPALRGLCLALAEAYSVAESTTVTADDVWRRHKHALNALAEEHGINRYLLEVTMRLQAGDLESPYAALRMVERYAAGGGPTKRELRQAYEGRS